MKELLVLSVNMALLQGGRAQGPPDKEKREACDPFHEAIPGYA